MTIEERIEPKQLHEWYLEAVESLSPDSYNAKAKVAYEDLTDEQKQIDIYIAKKLADLFTSELAKEREKVIKEIGSSEFLDKVLQENWKAQAEGWEFKNGLSIEDTLIIVSEKLKDSEDK